MVFRSIDSHAPMQAAQLVSVRSARVLRPQRTYVVFGVKVRMKHRSVWHQTDLQLELAITDQMRVHFLQFHLIAA